MENKKEIKKILLELDDISNLQYNRLVDIYGKRNVDLVIKKLVNDDDRLALKLGRFVTNNDLSMPLENLSAYDYYINDISSLSELSLTHKRELINQIVFIISELNKLFDRVGNISNIGNKRVKPWISDKVLFCLTYCNDLELLNKIKVLYKSFVEKRNELVEDNLKFVILCSKLYHNRECGVEFEDLIQYGNLGIMRAVETYNPEYDTEFVTYAGYWIKQSIITNSKKIMHQFKIPVYVYSENNDRLRVSDILTNELGRVPTDVEIADYMGVSNNRVKLIRNTFLPTIPLDGSAGIYIDGCEVTNIELIPDNEVNLEEDMFKKEMVIKLEEVMNKYLDDREIFILRNTYGLDAFETEANLGRELGVSSQRVHQIKKRAINKLCRENDFRQLRIYLR